MKTPPNQEKNNEKISLLFSSQRLTIDVHPSSAYHIVLSSNNADRHRVTLSFTARSRMMPLTRARLFGNHSSMFRMFLDAMVILAVASGVSLPPQLPGRRSHNASTPGAKKPGKDHGAMVSEFPANGVITPVYFPLRW